jgi:hypothetical protein
MAIGFKPCDLDMVKQGKEKLPVHTKVSNAIETKGLDTFKVHPVGCAHRLDRMWTSAEPGHNSHEPL